MLVSETCMFVRLRAKPECDNTGEDRIKPSKIHGYSLLQSTSGKKIHPYEKKVPIWGISHIVCQMRFNVN